MESNLILQDDNIPLNLSITKFHPKNQDIIASIGNPKYKKATWQPLRMLEP